jgi:hypothetical protein
MLTAKTLHIQILQYLNMIMRKLLILFKIVDILIERFKKSSFSESIK